MMTNYIHFIMYINIESLCCTTETNTILYVNYSSMINKSQQSEKYSNPNSEPRFINNKVK